MTTYLIIDLPEDYPILSEKAGSDTHIIPISAVAEASLRKVNHRFQSVKLSSLISQEEITTLVSQRAQQLVQRCFSDDNCAYYKVKQIIDACIEKQVIVEALSALPGQKLFVDTSTVRLSVEVELSESLRLASLYMRNNTGFVAVRKKRQPWFKKASTDVLRLIYHTIKNRSATSSGPLVIASGYKTAERFPAKQYQYLSNGHLIFALLRQKELSFVSRLANILEVIKLFLPVRVCIHKLTGTPPHHVLVELLQKRAQTIHRITEHLAKSNWANAPWMFTVYYPSLITIAMVRSAHKCGIPVVSMQHSIVGHDNWLASRYFDAYVSDAKLVSSAYVATQLHQIDGVDIDYIPARLPHFKERQPELQTWNGHSVTYVLTGFTRANTMYDNRRMNDWFYYQACKHHISVLKKRFITRVRPHPFDRRHYNNIIVSSLAGTCEIVTGPFEQCGAAIVMNSPTTSFGDAVRMGMHVFVINVTCKLRQDFKMKATEYGIFHDSIEQLMDYINCTSTGEIRQQQTSFRDWFLPLYLGTDELPEVDEALKKWYQKSRT